MKYSYVYEERGYAGEAVEMEIELCLGMEYGIEKSRVYDIDIELTVIDR